MEKKRTYELNEQYAEKTRQFQKLQLIYDKLKRRTLLQNAQQPAISTEYQSPFRSQQSSFLNQSKRDVMQSATNRQQFQPHISHSQTVMGGRQQPHGVGGYSAQTSGTKPLSHFKPSPVRPSLSSQNDLMPRPVSSRSGTPMPSLGQTNYKKSELNGYLNGEGMMV